MKEIISYGHFQCQELSPHKNRGMEISLIEEGILEWMVDGVPETLDAGTIFFTLPWQVHGGTTPKQPHNKLYHALFHIGHESSPSNEFLFPAALEFSLEESRILSRAFSQSTRHAFPSTPAARWLIPSLVRELQSQHQLREAYTTSILRALLIELKRIITGETACQTTRSPTERRAQQLIKAMTKDCACAWDLKNMGEFCNVGRTQLNTTFMRLTGTTPMAYLSRLRIEHAKTLLRETDDPVTKIAFQCGANSSQYFANVFKKATGMTPSGFRRESQLLTKQTDEIWQRFDFRSEEEEHERVRSFTQNAGG